jgi:hypothetical protein
VVGPRGGRGLRQRLAELDVDPSSYTRIVLFYDGSSDAPCRRPRVYAFTAPGSRAVRTCPTLGALVASAPEQAEAIVIHEVLHTLMCHHLLLVSPLRCVNRLVENRFFQNTLRVQEKHHDPLV